MSLWFAILLDEAVGTFARVSTGGAGLWCGICASSARRPGWRTSFEARKPRHGAPALHWDRQAPRSFARRVGDHDRRCHLSIMAQNVAGSIIKIQYRAPPPGIALRIKFTLAQQADMRRVTRSRTQTSAASSDMNNVRDLLMNDVHDSLPRFEREHVAIIGATLGRRRPLRRNP